jgi:putative restriction endonuclease
MDLAAERQMRDAAMAWLRDKESSGITAFSRRDCFSYLGRDIRLMNPQAGIWKPAGWRGALSISTVYTPESGARPYEDAEIGPDGLGRYKWRGFDPDHADNRALRAAMEYHLPLIWFLGFTPGRYAAVYPVYLVKEEPDRHQFVVAVDVIDQLASLDIVYPSADIEVAYTRRETKQRLHQAPFRAAVLDAYTCRCAVCRFGHADLLDAAHIVADADGGRAHVTNGLSLCKMHHAAYDADLIGITPNLVVEVNHDVLNEIDGPMLRHGIQEFHGQPLMVVPDKRSLRPDPEALRARYAQFLSRA